MKMGSPKIIVSDRRGKMYDLPFLEGTGMKGRNFFRLSPRELIKMPHGSELFMLPGRMPVGYDSRIRRFVALEGFLPVAAFLSPGYAVTYNTSYSEVDSPKTLPLFSYGAVTLYKGDCYVAALRVDRELRQDLRCMKVH